MTHAPRHGALRGTIEGQRPLGARLTRSPSVSDWSQAPTSHVNVVGPDSRHITMYYQQAAIQSTINGDASWERWKESQVVSIGVAGAQWPRVRNLCPCSVKPADQALRRFPLLLPHPSEWLLHGGRPGDPAAAPPRVPFRPGAPESQLQQGKSQTR